MSFRLRQSMFVWLSLLALITGFISLDIQPQTVIADGFVDTSFKAVWERTDQPVATRKVARTWMWGPNPGISVYEEYGSNGQRRLVQYFDKSRMEITNTAGDRNSEWYVTNGLLAKELI